MVVSMAGLRNIVETLFGVTMDVPPAPMAAAECSDVWPAPCMFSAGAACDRAVPGITARRSAMDTVRTICDVMLCLIVSKLPGLLAERYRGMYPYYRSCSLSEGADHLLHNSVHRGAAGRGCR